MGSSPLAFGQKYPVLITTESCCGLEGLGEVEVVMHQSPGQRCLEGEPRIATAWDARFSS